MEEGFTIKEEKAVTCPHCEHSHEAWTHKCSVSGFVSCFKCGEVFKFETMEIRVYNSRKLNEKELRFLEGKE